MSEPHEFWLLCAKAKRENNLELDILVQALAELCSHREYANMTPEEVYDTVKRHTQENKNI